MTTTVKSVAIRVGLDGKAQVMADWKDVGDASAQAGQAAASGSDQATAALTRQEQALLRQASAAKAQATAYSAQSGYAALLGLNTGPSKSAADSAAVFRDMAQAEAELETRSNALRAAIDPVWAAQQKLSAATADAEDLFTVGKISQDEYTAALLLAQNAYDGVANAAEIAIEKQRIVAQTTTEAAAAQEAYNAVLGVNVGPSKSAADSAAVFTAAAAAEQDMATRSNALRAAIDPVWAAEQKLSAATANANELFAAGSITAEVHAAALGLAAKEFEEAEKAARSMATGLGLSQMQMMELGHSARAIADALASGMNPARAFAMESARLGQVLGEGQGGLTGILGLLGAVAASPITWIVALGAAMAAAAVDGLMWSDNQQKLQHDLQGLGAASEVTLGQINAMADGVAHAANISLGAAKDLEGALAATGRGSPDVLGQSGAAIMSLRAFAGMDFKTARADLMALFEDPAKEAQLLAEKTSILSADQVDAIRIAELQGDRTKALALAMADLTSTGAGLEPHMGPWATLGNDIAKGWSMAADALGGFMAQAMHLKSADPQARLADLADQRNALANAAPDTSAFASAINAQRQQQIQNLDNQMAAQMAKIDAQEKAGATAKSNQASNDLRTIMDQIDPAFEKIQKLQAMKTALQDSLKDPALLASTGRTPADVQAMIGGADAQIQRLQKRQVAHNAHAEALKRELEAMQANAQGSLQMAQAYLVSDAAGAQAEATRKAVTDATKKGADINAVVAAQIIQNAADAVAAGAKQTAALRDQTGAQADANAMVVSGAESYSDAQRAMAIHLALLPELTAKQLLEAEAAKLSAAGFGEQSKQLVLIRSLIAEATTEIEAHTKALQDNNAAKATAAVLSANENDREQLAVIQTEIALVDDLTGSREALVAAMQAENQARKEGASPSEQADRGQSAAGVASAQFQQRQAQWLSQTNRAQNDNLALTQAELTLVGKTQDEHDAIIDRLKMEQQLKAEGVDLSSAAAKAVLAEVAANDDLNAKLRAMQTNWNELKSAGDQFVDDVLNPQNWTSWGDFGKKVITDLATEFEKLALINPLKNALFGEQNATLGGVGGLLGNLFGGGAGAVPIPEFYASGTNYSAEGSAVVGEKGAELVDLPGGSTVHDHASSVDMVSQAAAETLQNMQKMAANDSGGGLVIQLGDFTVNAQGAGPSETSAIRSEVAALRRSLPQLIVTTVNDQYQRRTIKLGRP